MKIDVRHIAKLSKLRLEEDRIPMFEQQMEAMVEMVEHLPPLDSALAAPDEKDAMKLRPDVVGQSLKRDELLAAAPKKNAGCFVVPKTVQ